MFIKIIARMLLGILVLASVSAQAKPFKNTLNLDEIAKTFVGKYEVIECTTDPYFFKDFPDDADQRNVEIIINERDKLVVGKMDSVNNEFNGLMYIGLSKHSHTVFGFFDPLPALSREHWKTSFKNGVLHSRYIEYSSFGLLCPPIEVEDERVYWKDDILMVEHSNTRESVSTGYVCKLKKG